MKHTRHTSQSNLRKRLARIDHLAAWLAIPFLAAATVVYFIPSAPAWTQGFNLVFQLFFVIHALLSIYRFRLPRFKPSAKIFQVYSGYGILLTVVLNMIFYGQEPYAALAFWTNWAFVAIHLVISVRFWLKRQKRK